MSGASIGSSIPEMLGFAPVSYEREKRYSASSYQALYCLTEEEARDIRSAHMSHPGIDSALSMRYIHDAAYHSRIDDARKDISASQPTEDVRRSMRRLVSKMTPPTEEAKRAVEQLIGELPEDRDGAA